MTHKKDFDYLQYTSNMKDKFNIGFDILVSS
jgi:hypothetical protein